MLRLDLLIAFRKTPETRAPAFDSDCRKWVHNRYARLVLGPFIFYSTLRIWQVGASFPISNPKLADSDSVQLGFLRRLRAAKTLTRCAMCSQGTHPQRVKEV